MFNSVTLVILLLVLGSQSFGSDAPLYKPSSRSTEAISISNNDYGGNSLAPAALGIGETAPNFHLPKNSGGDYELYAALKTKPVAVIFYRGHW